MWCCLQEDGRFRASADRTSTPSALNAGYGYSIIAAAWKSVQGSPAGQLALAAVQTLRELVNDATGSEATTLEFGAQDAGADRLATTAGVWAGVAELSAVVGDAVELGGSPAEAAAFARFFLSQRGATSVSDAANVSAVVWSCGVGDWG